MAPLLETERLFLRGHALKDFPAHAAMWTDPRTLRHIGWFEVLQTRGHVENGKVAHYQVILKVGFTLEDE